MPDGTCCGGASLRTMEAVDPSVAKKTWRTAGRARHRREWNFVLGFGRSNRRLVDFGNAAKRQDDLHHGNRQRGLDLACNSADVN